MDGATDTVEVTSQPPAGLAFIEAVNQLNAEKAALQAEVADLKTKLKSAQDSFKYASEQRAEMQAEVDQLHLLLDALPGAAPRKSQAENSWDSKDHKAMTRLAAYLASRSAT